MHVTANPGLSIRAQAVKRMGILFSYAKQRATARVALTRLLEPLRGMKGSMSGQHALVLANGQSVQKLHPEKVNAEKAVGLHIYALNSFLLSEFSRQVEPTHYVLSDPAHRPSNSSELALALWSQLKLLPEIQLFAGHTFFPSAELVRPSTVFFNDFGLEGWTRNISPLKPRGYLSLTAYKALAIALYLGYSPIFILGFDNSHFVNFKSDSEGNLWFGGNTHFYSPDSPQINMKNRYPRGFADCLFDYSLTFLDLVRCFAGQNIINLDVDSNTDAFPKIASDRFLRQQPRPSVHA